MFDDIKENIINFITSRLTLLTLLFILLGGVLVYRCFELQIVRGEDYLNDFMLSTEKTRDIASARGNILDRNGYVLAYNELAYSVKIEDVYEKTNKNKNMNATIYRLIKLIEKNGDNVITDFKIVLDEDGEFAFTAEGTSHLRFLADVYDHRTVDEVSEEEKASTALDVMESLSRASAKSGFAYGIGEYEVAGDSDTPFVPGKGYTREEWLKMVTIRFAMQQTSFRKYIGTIVATNVSDETVAVIMENSEELPGVTIVEDTVRRYNDSKYFAHVLGYTGKISSDELVSLNEQMAAEGGGEPYDINDVVGKSGLEASMETTLQGTKGSEKVVTNATGKVMSILERTEPQSGQDVYCTLDHDLQIAVYNIVEQKLAGLVSDKIRNIKEYKAGAGASSSDIVIPIYDVYYAVINNSVVDIRHFSDPEAGETEKVVYETYLNYKEDVYERLRHELTEGKTPYNKLSTEYQVYQSNIVRMLRDEKGVIMAEAVIADDPTQVAWAVDEVISLGEYLDYCIAMNWIDVSKLDLGEKYSDSAEIYSRLVDYIIDMIDHSTEFQKRFYKYMLLNDKISGKQVCMLLCEQDAIELAPEDETALYNGRITAYDFMLNRINNLDITPAQLALDPCNASVVITDVNTGDVLCMVSYPGYDNNKMANSIDAEYFAWLNADKAQTQLNFATQYKAAPGSTFKIVSASAGLMEGVITLRDTVSCTGTYTAVQPNSPRCWNRYGHGSENVTTAIRDSCNFFFYDVGYKLATRSGSYNDTEGLNTLYQYADLFGLTEKSGVEINEYPPDFSDIDTVRSAIGQGSHSYTTVGLARYVTTIANRGTCYDLTLIDKVTNSEGTVTMEQEPKVRNIIEMPDQYWDSFHLGMRQVVENKSYFKDLAVKVAGKTGTAEQSKSRPNHALFICFAPYDAPEIAIATRIPFGYSSDHAAQTTRDIIKYYYGLAEEDELITGTADTPDGGVSNEL